MSSTVHPFDRSGLASLSDLETPQWREEFLELEKGQASFLEKAPLFRSPDYKWPADPLHEWSRVWEYPYVYYHLKRWRHEYKEQTSPKVVDLGSGVTFFPFMVARLGCHVICVDTDPVACKDVMKAAGVVPHAPGKVEFRSCSHDLPFERGEIDALFCVSVLEHIPNPEKTITEMARVLKPGGLLMLTIDLDLRGDSEIGPDSYSRLMDALSEKFTFLMPERTVHPRNVLTSATGPYPVPERGGLRWKLQETLRRTLGKPAIPARPFLLTVMGSSLVAK